MPKKNADRPADRRITDKRADTVTQVPPRPGKDKSGSSGSGKSGNKKK